MSTPAVSNTNEQPQENIHRSSSLLSLVKGLLTRLLSFFLLQCQLIRRAAPAVNLINGNPKPHDQSSSLLFSSLPYDVVLNCLARVPRRHYPNLSCVSKSFRSLVRSPELAHMRSLIGKDYPLFYLCFSETSTTRRKFHWFTLNLNEKKTSDLKTSIRVLSQQMLYCSTVSIGSKIYFVGGSSMSMYNTSRGLWIFDSRSGELCDGPSMKVARMFPGVAVVDGKLYVMGGCSVDQIIQVEVFDLKTQNWTVAPLSPHGEIQYEYGLMRYGATVTQAVAFDEGKVYGMSYREGISHIIYDTKDGKCETFNMEIRDAYLLHFWVLPLLRFNQRLNSQQYWMRGGVCVINNVIYVYYMNFGLMWYDSKDKVWRVVKGLKNLDKSINMAAMVDCNGKIGILWDDLGDVISRKIKKRIWCAMISLDRSGVEIHGKVEWSDLVGSVPHYYDIWRCLGVSD